MLFPPPQGFPKLFINNWFPSCISAKKAGNRRDGTKRLSWIRSNKKGLRYGRFCSFQCFKIWPDCLNFKHWPILSSASGALLISWTQYTCIIRSELSFTVKSTLNYNRVLQQKKKKKKRINQLYPDQTPLYATSDQDVHGLGINLSNLGPTNRVDQNKKEEEENGCVQAVHSFITLSKATFDLLDTPTAPGCFAVSVYSHVSHKRINYQITVTDNSC